MSVAYNDLVGNDFGLCRCSVGMLNIVDEQQILIDCVGVTLGVALGVDFRLTRCNVENAKELI